MTMTSRKVVVAAPSSNKAEKIEGFTGSTFADLKEHPLFVKLYGAGTNVDVILNPGNLTLKLDDAELPEGDFRVFIVPTKNKGGMDIDAAFDLGDEISKAIMDAAERASNNDVEELKRRLKREIDNFFDVTIGKDCPECEAALEESKKYV